LNEAPIHDILDFVMPIHIIADKATSEQQDEMLAALRSYIKLAVDIKKRVLAGGGTLHSDCEAVLLDHGSKQEDVWGADWLPNSKEVGFESLINIRPTLDNRSMKIQHPQIRKTVDEIVRERLGYGSSRKD
jgi:hypothetical protein